MQRRYRRRSWLGLTFWSVALVGPTALTAWKFDWLPLAPDAGETVVASVPPAGSATATDEPRTLPNLVENPAVNPIVFSQQTEPPDEWDGNELPATDHFTIDQVQSPRPISGLPRPEHQQHQLAAASSGSERQPQPVRQEGSVRQSALANSRPGRQIEQVSNDVEPQPGSDTPLEIDLAAIDQQIPAGDVLAAHRTLSEAYWNHPELRHAIRPRIEKTAHSIFFSPFPHYLEPYVVQPGDQLRVVARKYNVPWQYLSKLNRVEPQRIRADQRLKVVQGPFSAVVDLSDFEMTIHARGYFVCVYPVGIGKDNSTPTGKFPVLNKVINPQYTAPDGKVIDADDPANPLGERWIDLGGSYGIHGTVEPDSVGRAESRGCIRLRNEDIEDAFDLLVDGSEVIIRP